MQSWYDTVYMPMVEAIRRYGVLEHFPTRTETDLYLDCASSGRTAPALRSGAAEATPRSAPSRRSTAGDRWKSGQGGLRFGLQRLRSGRTAVGDERGRVRVSRRHDAGEIHAGRGRKERAQDDADEAGDDLMSTATP
ncbi:MAG: hypothetical protein R2854_01145 [Caldilineaceae bacterium]